MSWLNAHELYVMETITRDRIDELRSTLEFATHDEYPGAPSAALSDARATTANAVVLCPRALAKTSR